MTESESGVSMLSSIVAVALMTMAIGLGGRAVSGTLGAAERLSESARFQATLARFDAELVLAAARIRQPVWLGQAAVCASGNEISISYLDGDPSGDLLLRWDEDGASLVTGNASSVFRGLAITHATADPLPPAHLIVKIETDRGDSITVTAPFALFPLPQP